MICAVFVLAFVKSAVIYCQKSLPPPFSDIMHRYYSERHYTGLISLETKTKEKKKGKFPQNAAYRFTEQRTPVESVKLPSKRRECRDVTRRE